MILHKFNTSPFAHSTIRDSLKRIQSADGIVLTEDAVYALIDKTLCLKLSELTDHIYVLQADILARGLANQCHSFSNIDYSELVNLTLKFDNVISW